MAPNQLLIELGVEELPASYIEPALKDLATSLTTRLKDERLTTDAFAFQVFSTPRRLAVTLQGLLAKQTACEEEIFGPPLASAKDAKGEWSQAALGFAQKNGITPAQFQTKKDPKGIEKIFIQKTLPQNTLEHTVAEILPEIITKLKFPKSMRFIPNKPFRFARPLRWLVVLHNSSSIPMEVAELKSGSITYGHRFLTDNARITLKDADPKVYVDILKQYRVLVDRSERRAEVVRLLTEALPKVCKNPDTEAILDERLIDMVTNCIEYPGLVIGEYNPDFLKMPAVVPVTSMKHHQKYFPIIDKNEGLKPGFLSITNGAGKSELIKIGNQRVLSARLADALFFYQEDIKISLDQRYDDLKKVSFHKEIGSYWDKTESMRTWAKNFASQLRWDAKKTDILDRAVKLSKTDLVTHMVYEFPELQGVMGGEYAACFKEAPEVALALKEQYRQQPASSDIGNMLIAADRWDTLVGAFKSGLKVTGSSDPYGLRRAGLTLVHIIHHTQWPLKLSCDKNTETLFSFLLERLDFYAKDTLGIRHDVIKAVQAKPSHDLDILNLISRMQAIQTCLNEEKSFADFLVLCGRIVNILQQAQEKKVLPSSTADASYSTPLAKALDGAITILEKKYPKPHSANTQELLRDVAILKPTIDAFFDGVMVFHEDTQQRHSNLVLLQRIENLFKHVGDFAQIVK